MRRNLACVAVLAALLPVSVAGVTAPDPSVLKGALADPASSGYVEADLGTKGEGPLDGAAWAQVQTTDPAAQARIERGLADYGFVSGYGRIWVKRGGGVALVEQILVFDRASNAAAYEHVSKLADRTASAYVSDFDTSAIPNSYGVEDLLSGTDAATVAFVKGNDLFGVGVVATSGYMTGEAIAQAQAVEAAAPDYTIQPPAATATDSAAQSVGSVAGAVIVGLLVLGVVLLIVGLVIRATRRPELHGAGAPLAVQMSGDGRYWWDGSAWQDAGLVAPAHAQRSPDGNYWWDGRSWRLVPAPQAVQR